MSFIFFIEKAVKEKHGMWFLGKGMGVIVNCGCNLNKKRPADWFSTTLGADDGLTKRKDPSWV